ncbi:MAG TPA: hypothetical protein VGE11_19875 [Pseudonocardia sp.]
MADYDQSGDYGYDMLDEMRTAQAVPARRVTRYPYAGTGIAREMDPDGDYGYDSAHEL